MRKFSIINCKSVATGTSGFYLFKFRTFSVTSIFRDDDHFDEDESDEEDEEDELDIYLEALRKANERRRLKREEEWKKEQELHGYDDEDYDEFSQSAEDDDEDDSKDTLPRINDKPGGLYKYYFRDLSEDFDAERFKGYLTPSKSYLMVLLKLYFMYWYINLQYRYSRGAKWVYHDLYTSVAAFIFFFFFLPGMYLFYHSNPSF
jgi:hypothetical protein